MQKRVFKTKGLFAILMTVIVIISAITVSASAEEEQIPGFVFSSYEDKDADYKYPDASYTIEKRLDKIPQTVSAWIYVPSSLTSSEVGAIIGNSEGRLSESGIDFVIGSGAVPTISIQNKYKGDKKLHYDVKFESSNSIVPTDSWTYVTFVYDNASGIASCYINGTISECKYFYPAIDEEVLVNGFVLGGDNRELNHGYFKGGLGDVTLYSDVRTAEEIKSDFEKGREMTKADLDTDNVISYYDVDENDIGKNITDDSTNGYDVTCEKTWITEEEMKELRKSYGFTPSYSFAVVGDTQKITRFYPQNLPSIYDYIVKNIDSKNIKYSIGLGDITDKSGRAEGGSFVFVENEDEPGGGHYERNDAGTFNEWDVAYHSITIMDGNLEYSLIAGNHDNGNDLDAYFASDKDYTSQFVNHGGIYGYDTLTESTAINSVNNTWRTFSVGNVKYLIMNIAYNANDNVFNWANEVLSREEHLDHNVIITTHAYLDCDGTALDSGDINCGTKNSGVYLWENLVSKHKNVKIMLSGHVDVDSVVYSQRKGDNGNTVTQILVNPQGMDLHIKAPSMVAMFYFSEDGQSLAIEYYSTVRGVYLKTPKVISLTADAETIEEDGGWMGNSIAPAGNGTESAPYIISNGGNLLWMAEQIAMGTSASLDGMYFEQTSDIDLNGNSIYSIGYYYGGQSDMATFGGHYDGNGYSIKNGSIHPFSRSNESSVAYGYGLFGVIFGATVEDVVLDNVEVIGAGLTGGIVGRAASPVVTDGNFAGFNIISGCEIKNTVKFVLGDIASSSVFDNASRGGRFGSICGMAHNTVIEGCTSAASVKFGGDYGIGGGIAGTAGLNTVVDNCAFTGTLTLCDNTATAESYYGGIVGVASPSDKTTDKLGNTEKEHGYLTVTNCYSTASYQYTDAGEASEVIFNGVIAYSTLAAGNVYTAANCFTEQNSEIDLAIAEVRSSELSVIWYSGKGKPAFTPTSSNVKYYDADSSFYYTYDGSEWKMAGGEETEYGIIPDSYANVDDYPFVIFKNGEFKGAGDSWNTSKTEGVIANAIALATDKSDVVTVVLRRDYNHAQTTTPNSYNALVGTLNVDLGEHNITTARELIQFNHKIANNTVNINIYNGTITVTGRRLMSFQNQSSTVRQDLKLTFKDVTIDYRSSWSLVEGVDNTTGLCAADVIFEDCTINLTNYSGSAFNFITASNDTNKSHLMHIIFKGGEFKSNVDFTGKLISKNTGYPEGEADTLTFEKNSEGKYTKFTMPVDLSAPTNTYDSTDLAYLKVSSDTENATYELIETVLLGYGEIPEEYLDKELYPFLIFKNGKCVGAGDNWNTSKTAGVIPTAISLTSDGSEVTVVLRRDFENRATATPNTYNNLVGTLNIDLGGNTLYSYREIIQFNHKVSEGTVNVNIKNGNIVIEARRLVNLLNQSATVRQDLKLTFTDVNIKTKTNWSIIETTDSADTETGLCVADVIFENCTLDLTAQESAFYLFAAAKDSYASHVTHVLFKGGEIISTVDFSEKLMSRKTGYANGEADTLKFEKNSEGTYTGFIMPSSLSSPTNIYDSDDRISYALISTDGTNSIYVLGEDVSTEYGDIPFAYSDIAKYPFILFQNGSYKTAYATWFDFLKNIGSVDTSEAMNSTLLVRDNHTSTASSANWYTIKYLTIDLDGKTLTRGSYHLFNLSGRDNVEFTANITVKNGTLNTTHSVNPPISFNSNNSVETDAKFNVTFDNVIFTCSSEHGSNLVLVAFSDGKYGTVNTMVFNNCTFDASKGGVTGLFGMEDGSESNKFDINVIVNGGKVIANKYFDLATFSPERDDGDGSPDSLAFGKNGLTVVLPESAAAPDTSDTYITAEGVECVFVKASETDGNANYSLYPKVMVGYKIKTSVTLYSNFVYNIYIPEANFNKAYIGNDEVAVALVTIEGENYYHVAVNLPVANSLNDIKLTVRLNSGDTTVDANWTLSVLNYAKSIVNGSYDEVTNNLVKDMLVYASAAYTYFGEDLEEKAAEISTLLDGYTKDMPTETTAVNTTSKTYFSDVVISLDEVPSFRFYLTDGYTADDFTFKVGTRNVEATLSEDGKYLEITMYAYMMLDTVSYTVTDKTTNTEVTEQYNLYSYYEFAKTLNDANLVSVVEGLIKYSASAADYRKSVIAAD